MLIEIIIICALLGLFSGFTAGLLGAGGGLIIVPFLLFFLPHWGFEQAIAAHTAIGTSLATIVMTGMVSVFAHHRRQAVNWQLLAWFIPGLTLGALLGAISAKLMSGLVLQIVFGFFMVLMALRMLSRKASAVIKSKPLIAWHCLPAGVVIAWISALAGIGGGSLTVPFLNQRQVVMQEAVGTSSACGVPLAFAGTVGFIITGFPLTQHLPLASGFVYWPAWLGIVASSLVSAQWGAHFAHRLPAAQLKKIFAVFLLLIGFKILVSASA